MALVDLAECSLPLSGVTRTCLEGDQNSLDPKRTGGVLHFKQLVQDCDGRQCFGIAKDFPDLVTGFALLAVRGVIRSFLSSLCYRSWLILVVSLGGTLA